MKKLKVTDEKVANKYLNLLKSARRRNLEFNLSFGDIRRLLQAPACYYTGEVFTNVDANDDHFKTIDRVDNEKGYVKGNVVACTNVFNQIKGGLTLTDITRLWLGVKDI